MRDNTKSFLIIADGSVKIRVVATTKWHAMDKAVEVYPQYKSFRCGTLKRTVC